VDGPLRRKKGLVTDFIIFFAGPLFAIGLPILTLILALVAGAWRRPLAIRLAVVITCAILAIPVNTEFGSNHWPAPWWMALGGTKFEWLDVSLMLIWVIAFVLCFTISAAAAWAIRAE